MIAAAISPNTANVVRSKVSLTTSAKTRGPEKSSKKTAPETRRFSLPRNEKSPSVPRLPQKQHTSSHNTIAARTSASKAEMVTTVSVDTKSFSTTETHSSKPGASSQQTCSVSSSNHRIIHQLPVSDSTVSSCHNTLNHNEASASADRESIVLSQSPDSPPYKASSSTTQQTSTPIFAQLQNQLNSPNCTNLLDKEHTMTSGIVPVRPPSYLPRMVKLPRRYEKAALGDPKTARHRKVSLCGPPSHMRQSYSDRVDDLMTAIMWVKQELIFLRQNDILLKKQFFNIHDSIQAIHRQENLAEMSSVPLSSSLSISSSSYRKQSKSSIYKPFNQLTHPTKSTQQSSPLTIPNFGDPVNNRITITENTKGADKNNNKSEPPVVNNHAVSNNESDHSISTPIHIAYTKPSSHSPSPSPIQSPSSLRQKHPNGLLNHLCSSQSFLFFDSLPSKITSSSTTVLNSTNNKSPNCSDDDSDGDDVFDTNYFRPRTSSMKTSRDMAAIARRRGSKDLV